MLCKNWLSSLIIGINTDSKPVRQFEGNEASLVLTCQPSAPVHRLRREAVSLGSRNVAINLVILSLVVPFLTGKAQAGRRRDRESFNEPKPTRHPRSYHIGPTFTHTTRASGL